jgi:hypothetical protein
VLAEQLVAPALIRSRPVGKVPELLAEALELLEEG